MLVKFSVPTFQILICNVDLNILYNLLLRIILEQCFYDMFA